MRGRATLVVIKSGLVCRTIALQATRPLLAGESPIAGARLTKLGVDPSGRGHGYYKGADSKLTSFALPDVKVFTLAVRRTLAVLARCTCYNAWFAASGFDRAAAGTAPFRSALSGWARCGTARAEIAAADPSAGAARMQVIDLVLTRAS